MSQLAAMGLIDEEGRPTWQQESRIEHLRLALSHACRAMFLAMTSFLSLLNCCRRRREPEVQPFQLPANAPTSASIHRNENGKNLENGESGECEQEPTASELADRCLIIPGAPGKERWDLLILFCILYSAVVVPFRVAFDAQADGFLWYFEVTMTLVFLVDVVLSFSTVIYDSFTGRWITSRKKIACRYMTGWFWVDGPSSVPVEIISLYVDADRLVVLRVLRVVRLLRLLKVLKVDEFIDALENYTDTSLRILRIVFMRR